MRPVGTRSAPEECGHQYPEAGGEDAERAIPAHVASCPAWAGDIRRSESGSCRSSFTSRMMGGSVVSAREDGASRDAARPLLQEHRLRKGVHERSLAGRNRASLGATHLRKEPRAGGLHRPRGPRSGPAEQPPRARSSTDGGERSGGGRVEDGGLVPGRPSGRFIGREPVRSDFGEPHGGRPGPTTDRGPRARTEPTAPAWERRGNTPDPSKARAPGDRAGPPGRWTCAGDQAVEPVVVEEPVGLRGHQMVAAGLGRSGAARPWARSNTSAPVPHRASRSNGIDLMIPLQLRPPKGRLPAEDDRPRDPPCVKCE